MKKIHLEMLLTDQGWDGTETKDLWAGFPPKKATDGGRPWDRYVSKLRWHSQAANIDLYTYHGINENLQRI